MVKVNDTAGSAELSAAVLLADYVTLVSALQEKYVASLAAGNALLYETTQFSTAELFLAASAAGDLAASISKPVSRLNSVLLPLCLPCLATTS